jgi:4-amino-4-deoxy-L-arabinose transferase-like glycosyltransferase
MASLKRLFDRKEILLFLFAFCVRLGIFVFLLWWFLLAGHLPETGWSYPTLGGDSADYAILTHNLFHNGTFSSSVAPPLIPESFRLPGYSFFLYPFQFLPHPLLWGMLAQIALGSLTVVLLYRLGRTFLSEKAGWWGALLLCVEPTTVLYSTLVMSDTLFVFSMVLGIYVLFTRPLSLRNALVTGVLAGLLFGYAVLVRTIAQYLAVCLVAAYAVVFHKELKPLSWTLLKIAAFFVGIALVMAPWALRNHAQFGTYTISSTPYINFTQYNLVYFYAYQHGTTPPEVQHLFSGRIPYPTDSFWFRSLINESIFRDMMREGLHGNIMPYAAFHLTKTLPFFLNDSLRDINRMTGILPPPQKTINFTDLLLRKDFGGIARYFITPQSDLWLLLAGATFWVSVSALWLFGVLHAAITRNKTFFFLVLVSGVILYFAVLSSPVIQPRYRMPAAPFMLLAAAYGALSLRDMLSKKAR